MKKKVGTIFDEDTLWRAKRAALREKIPLSALFERAVLQYLDRRVPHRAPGASSIVQRTKGKISIDPKLLKRLMREPDWHLF